ncbi:MAG: RsmD family RNA methyltransferase [Sedimentisphaerales bacterium]|jgi:16S rRNA (guanine(966)-N(2))-methyltransferase RsmD
MRIIAGAKRGMNLFSPPGRDSRPITDRVKQSLFDVLQKYDLPAGKVVADLFAGVGSLGLESLSRGAAFVTFVEHNPKIAPILEKNIAKAGFAGQSKVVRVDAFKIDMPVDVGQSQSATADKYDLVFVDPPYVDSASTQAGSPLASLLARLAERIASGGFVIVRTHQNTTLSQSYGSLKIIERRQWGTMAVTILRKAQDK